MTGWARQRRAGRSVLAAFDQVDLVAAARAVLAGPDAARGIDDALETQPELAESANVAEILRAVLSWLGTAKATSHTRTRGR